ncbi:helix-turn-helix transcriptional regulator [Pseudomonas sp. NPDC077186]|uniref:helix-turn-helix transcriptional regulator n=1 Tax=Pseudomonas sp. NPDC077186 TaxID=3364421 RepID=UPI0037C56979
MTLKEQDVLQLLARNISNKQIALALNVGEERVKWHLKNLFGKFRAGTRRHVVDRTYLLGILETERWLTEYEEPVISSMIPEVPGV